MADKLPASPAPKDPAGAAENSDVQAFRAWIEKNGTPILYAVLAAVVVLLALTVWQNRKRAAAEQAAQALFSTQDPDALLAIADGNASTPAAPLAVLQAAALFARQNLYEEALSAYDRFLAAAPAHDFGPLAKLGRALSLDALGRGDEALAALDELLEEGDATVLSAAGLSKGRIQEAKGDFAGARATYEEIIASAADYSTLAQAESALAALDGAEAAAVADAAPAEPAAEPAPETPAEVTAEEAVEAAPEAVEEAVAEAAAPEKPAKKSKAKKADGGKKKTKKAKKAAEEAAGDAPEAPVAE
jgi:predicted negative regulator of RcsB-dependent stress response